MRFGEVLGLTWDCIHIENKTIKTYRRYDCTRKRWTKAKTETSIRDVPIDDTTVSILQKLKAEQRYILRFLLILREVLLIQVEQLIL